MFACSNGENSDVRIVGGDKYGGVFSWNETEAVRSIFPLNMTQAASYRVIAPVYEGLVRFSATDLSIEAGLAESWKMFENGRVFEFALREGVRFHDDPCFPEGKGRELTVDDVVWCLTQVCVADERNQMFWLFQDQVLGANECYQRTRAGKKNGVSVEGITGRNEDRVVRIELISPNPGFLGILGHQGCWIYPKEFVEFHQEEIDVNAVGTGPFRLRKNEPGSVTLLERNPDYWRRSEEGDPLPYLDAVKISYLPKVSAEIAHFMKGNLSIVHELPLSELGLVDQVGAEGQVDYQVSTAPSLTVQFYCFNTNTEPFNNPLVRRAIAMSIDKQFIVDSVLSGQAVAATGGIVPPFFKDYPAVEGLKYAPDSARALLAAAGYPNGNGFPVLTLQFSGNGFGYVDVANAVQFMIKENLNLRVPISAIPSEQYFEIVETGQARFWREGWLADHPDPENFLTLFYGKNAPDAPNARTYLNTTRFSNKRFDSLFVAASQATDPLQRYALYSAADQVFVDEAPAIPIYFTNSTRLVRSDIRGLEHNGMEMIELSSVYFER
jgi:peptide/nickel transport system substrate-binding protein